MTRKTIKKRRGNKKRGTRKKRGGGKSKKVKKYIKIFQTSWDYVIFCRDTPRKNIWRNKIKYE